MNRRAPSGAAVPRPEITAALGQAVLDELVDKGYARLSMEGVARRAGAGKSALYRRWPSKQDMVLAVLAETAVPLADTADTGSLAGDIRSSVQTIADWVTDPRYSRILPDLAAEGVRNPALNQALQQAIGDRRRALARRKLVNAIERGELSPDTDLELAQDLIAGLIYWRVIVRQAPTEPDYLDRVTELILRALGA